MTRLLALALVVTTLPGCVLWFGNDGEDCTDEPVADQLPPENLRDPYTGQCQLVGGGGGGGGGTCGEFGGARSLEPAPAAQDWGQCLSACSGLDEVSCQATSGCRAAFVTGCVEGTDCQSDALIFAACWQMAPSGPATGEACIGLDAYGCSRHDDCVALHYSAVEPAPGGDGFAEPPAIGNFAACGAETAAPEQGTCYGEVYCDALPPECPPDSTPGVAADGCWTGQCIPVTECEPPPSCAEAASEGACIMRLECAPLYQGTDCSCDAAGVCGCRAWVYRTCAEATASP